MPAKPQKPWRIAVLGGGPAGLSAAHHLLRSSHALRVDLYEASPRTGGAVLTETSHGFRYELGPSSMNLKHAAVADLVRDKLGLAPRIQPRSPRAKRYYLFRDGALVPLPASPLQFARSALLTWRAKLRVLAEPFVREEGMEEESVGEFFGRRFGSEIVQYVIDPMLAGIYSARPAELSMKHALGGIRRLEREKGSVIGGMLKRRGKAEVDPRFGRYTGKELRASFSYDQGMEVLTTTLAARVKEMMGAGKVYRRSKVRTLEQDGDGAWRVNGRGKYDAVISTVPSHALASVYSNVRMVEKGFKRLKEQIRYAPVSVVVLGYDRAQIPHPLDGFGALLPSIEKRRILGVNFSSANFPDRVEDASKAYLTVYLGGSRNPELPFRPAREVVATSKLELRNVLGIQGEPFFSRVKTWAKGIPQYPPGFDEVLCTMARIEKRAPGLLFGGNYRDGVGLPDALLSGMNSADRAIRYLSEQPSA